MRGLAVFGRPINIRNGELIITHFVNLTLSPAIMRGLTRMGFTAPTPVQEAAIGPMLERRDLLVQAPTGTGKTCAFGIPVVEGIDAQSRRIQAVILCPTRELAIQTAAVLRQLMAFVPGVRIATLYGGEPIHHQITALRRKPQIVVATPGRMIDHINRHTARISGVNCVVLDEADRMLDMGFREDIDTILQNTPGEKQTVLFSATISGGVKRIASQYQTDAQLIHIRQDIQAVEKVEQYYLEIHKNTKTPALMELLGEKSFPLSLVFVSTKAMADTLAKDLTGAGFCADSLHGDLHQRQRDKVMEKYRSGKVKILVATDVAARGIDVNNIDAVINYDIPGDADSYVHRIGRTGRANQSGAAYTFIYPKERAKLRGIISGTNAAILPLDININPVNGYGSSSASASPKAGNVKKLWPKKPKQKKSRANGEQPLRFRTRYQPAT